MSILEIIAITFTLICVYLTSRQNILCWPTGIVSVIAFFLLYLNEELNVLYIKKKNVLEIISYKENYSFSLD